MLPKKLSLAPVITKLRFFGLKRLSTLYSRCKTKEIDAFKKTKAKLIQQMNFETSEDGLPFYNLPIKSLAHIYNVTKKDVESGYCKNRLYYIADAIKFSPTILSKYLVKRIFVYNLSFYWLANALKVLTDFRVPGDRIVRDLWVLKYHHNTIKERLQRVQDNGIDHLHPWMVRCPEDILNKCISNHLDAKEILGDMSLKLYLTMRLNSTPEEIEEIYTKLPALKTMRVSKLKRFLDFLILEGFNIDDIKDKARVLTASQSTVQQRLQLLRKMGVDYVNLNILCRSKKDFEKYCAAIEAIDKEK